MPLYYGIISSRPLIVSAFAINRKEHVISQALNILSNTGIALIILKRNVYKIAGEIPFYFISSIFIVMIISGFSPVSDFKSRNGISIVMLVVCIAFYIIALKNSNKINLIPALITLIISAHEKVIT